MNRLASVIIVSYDHGSYLENCIESINCQEYPHEIILVNNYCKEDLEGLLLDKYPNIKIINNSSNNGYGAGNNIGINYAHGDFIVILNPDTLVGKNWLAELLTPLERMNHVITTPKILSYDAKFINTCGILTHFSGLAFTRGLGADTNSYPNEEEVGGISGCCFAMKKRDFLDIGSFDECFFLYMEDTEFSWRAHLRGFRLLYIPASIVRHDYSLHVSPEKIYNLEFGRYILIRKIMTFRDILLITPSLLIVELLVFGYALKLGRKAIIYKLKAMKDGLTTNIVRIEGDRRNLFNSIDANIPPDQLSTNLFEIFIKIIINNIFRLNFKIFRWFYWEK
ncbi:Glycosyl transferase family 2 [uncultured archaeon]|nr:Glycosyl transferase family 2 [uncultured archaeon]